MDIVETTEHNTTTIVPGLSSIDITPGIPIPDLSRCEVVINYKMAQSTTNQRSMAVTVKKIAVDKIRFQRGGTSGGVVVGFSIVVYTVASGVIVEDYSDSLYQNPRPIPITSRDRSHRYSRITVRCTTDVGFDLMFVTQELLSSNDTLNIRGKNPSVSVHIEAQVVYMPDMTVHHFIGTATGTSYPVSLSGLGVVTDEAFCILSCRGSSLNPNNIKGANLSSNAQCDLYSYVSKSVYFTLQVCHRSNNLVIRNESIFSAVSFDVVAIVPDVILNRSFVNLPVSYNTYAPTDVSTDDAQHCAIKSIFNGVSSITLEKFILGYETTIYSEVVFVDGDSGINVDALAIAPTASIDVEKLETETTIVASVAAPTASFAVLADLDATLTALAIAPTASMTVEKLKLEITLVASVEAPTGENTVNNESFISKVVPFWTSSNYKGG